MAMTLVSPRASAVADTVETAAVRASVMCRPSITAMSAPVCGLNKQIAARWVGSPRAVFPPKTVTSLAPSAGGVRTRAGITPKNSRSPTGSTLRTGCTTSPREKRRRASVMASMRSPIDSSAATCSPVRRRKDVRDGATTPPAGLAATERRAVRCRTRAWRSAESRDIRCFRMPVRRDDQPALAADPHPGDALVPAADDLADADGERVTRAVGVELLTLAVRPGRVVEPARIGDRDAAARSPPWVPVPTTRSHLRIRSARRAGGGGCAVAASRGSDQECEHEQDAGHRS